MATASDEASDHAAPDATATMTMASGEAHAAPDATAIMTTASGEAHAAPDATATMTTASGEAHAAPDATTIMTTANGEAHAAPDAMAIMTMASGEIPAAPDAMAIITMASDEAHAAPDATAIRSWTVGWRSRPWTRAARWDSMVRAAEHLSISQSVVSKAVSDLEGVLGLPLLDRYPHGVKPTLYGRALLNRGNAVFNDLRASVIELQFLADPTAGGLALNG
jgi:regulatory helix-turn-helix LysR family protein